VGEEERRGGVSQDAPQVKCSFVDLIVAEKSTREIVFMLSEYE
jgi:hypothetical protein